MKADGAALRKPTVYGCNSSCLVHKLSDTLCTMTACMLFWEAQVPLAQVEQDGLVGFGKPAVHLVLGEAGAQSSQVACHGLVQAGQHQRA